MERDSCRLCEGELEVVLDLGDIYPSAFLDPDEDIQIDPVPLTLARCASCRVVQLKHTVDPDQMYRNYWYKSGLNPSMVNSLADVVGCVLERFDGDGGVVADIGANDGTMLRMFPTTFITVGFDPALNFKEEAESNCDIFVNDYFGNNWPIEEKADIVTAIAMFYDLDDPHQFLFDVMNILADDGILVIQMTDLVSMLKANAFDNICHEHLCYYSLLDMDLILGEHDLEIFDIEYNNVNGGSVRLYISWCGEYEVTDNYYNALEAEREYMDQFVDPMLAFVVRVVNNCLKTMSYLAEAKSRGKVIWGLGASTKGNTLLQFLGLKPPIIDKIAEVNRDKFGKETVGTKIPIVPEDPDVMYHRPDILLVLPWHFDSFFVEKFKDYLDGGGELFFPLPEAHSVSRKDR